MPARLIPSTSFIFSSDSWPDNQPRQPAVQVVACQTLLYETLHTSLRSHLPHLMDIAKRVSQPGSALYRPNRAWIGRIQQNCLSSLRAVANTETHSVRYDAARVPVAMFIEGSQHRLLHSLAVHEASGAGIPSPRIAKPPSAASLRPHRLPLLSCPLTVDSCHAQERHSYQVRLVLSLTYVFYANLVVLVANADLSRIK